MVVFILVELENAKLRWKQVQNALNRIRSTADYQFGKGTGVSLFPETVKITYSKATERIRYVLLNDKRLATLRPTDGLLCLSIVAAQIIAENQISAKCFVTVQNDVSEFIAKGGDVFSKHVVTVNNEVYSRDEVIILDENRQVLAVGRALLSAMEMKTFKTGVAVKVRHGYKN